MPQVQTTSANSQPAALPLVMSRPLVVLQALDTVSDALTKAREQRVHHFPVYGNGQLLGMLCTCDLQEAGLEQPVAEIMRPAVTIPASRSAADAALLMKAADVGSVLVLDWNGRACGIVTRGDLNGEPAEAILEDCRCECCGTAHHLHRYEGRQLCFSCRERAAEPAAFETGGGD
jgi:predicted transcriptional regulator